MSRPRKYQKFSCGEVCKRSNADTATRIKLPDNFKITWFQKFNQIIFYRIDNILVKVADTSETKQVKLKRFTFNQPFVGNVVDDNRRKVGLPRFRTETCKFGAVQSDKIIVVGKFIREPFKQIFIVSCHIFRLAAQ